MIDGMLAKLLHFFRISVVDVVKESTAKATTFTSIFNQEIAIRPIVKLCVLVIRIVAITYSFAGAMDVFHIFFVDAGRSDIRATSEPPV
jgi:hypothetical protein